RGGRCRGRGAAGGEAVLGFAGRDDVPRAELGKVVEWEVVAGEEEEGVEQHGAVAGGQDEAVPIGPARTGGGVLQVARPEGVGHRSGTHRETRMTGFRLLHRVSGEKPDGVDRHLLQFRVPHLLLSGRPLRPANPPTTVVWCASTLKQERISSACSHAGLRIRNRLDARRWGAAGTRGTGALRDPPASDGVLGSRGDGALRRTGRLPPDSSQRPAAGDGGADRGRRPPGWAGSSAAGPPQVASHDVGADGPAPPRVGWGVPTPRAGDPAGPGRPRAGTGPDREVARPWDRLHGESRWPAEQRLAR